MRRAAEATPLELVEPDPREAEPDARDAEPPDGGRVTADREGALRVVVLRDGALRVVVLREGALRVVVLREGALRVVVLREGELRDGSVIRLRMEALPLDRVCGVDERAGGAELRGAALELPFDRIPWDPRDSVVARGGPLRMISGDDDDRTLSRVADPLDARGSDDRMPLLDRSVDPAVR